MREPRMRRAWPYSLIVLAVSALAAVGAVTAPPVARAAEPVVVLQGTFEDGTTQGWTPRAGETVAASAAVAHGGSGSLAVTGRTRSWEGPTLNLLGTMQQGTRYTLSVWVRLAAGEAATQARLSVERRTAGTPSYDQVVGNTAVTADGWINLQGQYTLAQDVDFLTAYVETASGTASLHIDDFSLSYVPTPPIQTDIPSVRSVLADDFPIGAAVSRAQLVGDHADLLTRHFNSITAGNAMKWDATEPTEGTFRFDDADAIVAFAQANGMQVRGHTLAWHNQTPAWVFQDATGAPLPVNAASKQLVLSRLEAHIRAVVGRYAGRITAWDVVNEVIDEGQSDGMRRSRWYELTGLDFIRTAFRVTHEVDPAAKLFINDYNTNVPAKRDHLFNLVSTLRAEGVPIDGVGHQMHVNVQWPSLSETEAMLTRFIPLGVEQQITEMDVSIYTNTGESFPTPPQDRLLQQAYRYRDFFDLYRRYSDQITSVTVWGLADDDSWLDTFPVTRLDAPLLFDRQLQAKPAYWGIVDPSRIGTTASPTPTASSSPTGSPSPTASPPPTGSPSPTPTGTAACRVGYSVVNQWPGGFQGEVTVTNTAATAVNGWTLNWSFTAGQQVGQLWNGSYTQSGATVSATAATWNANLAPGASATVGFLASWAGSNPAPTSFSLNGTPCTLS